MDRETAEALRESAMGDYAHAGLGIGLGLALGPLTGLLLGTPAAGLALGIAAGLLAEGILEMQDGYRRRVARGQRR